METTMKAKRKFKLPHPLIIILSIVLFATLLTWFIPAGEFERVQNDAGITVVVPGTFKFKGSQRVNPIMIPHYIIQGSIGAANLMVFLLISGSAFNVLIETKALHSAVGSVAKKFASKETIFIPVLTTVLSLICTTQSLDSFMGFAPVMVLLTRALGYDSIVGIAILIFGCGTGFISGTVNPSITVIGQQIAELPIYSGMWYRAIIHVVLLIVSDIYLIHYARKVKKDPEKSPMYELDLQYKQEGSEGNLDSFGTMNARKWSIVLSLLIALAFIVYGGVVLKWGLTGNAGVYMFLAIVAGLLAGFTPSKIASIFVEGSRKMVSVLLVIGTARGIAEILTAGGVMDTVVYGLATGLNYLPRFLRGPAMYLANVIINVFIPSGSGQAAVVAPIFIPTADLAGMTRQTAVVALNLGSGHCDYIIPNGTTLMGCIGLARVPYEKWVQFIWKMFLIWLVVCSILVFIAQVIQLGPA
mgnify:FL=1